METKKSSHFMTVVAVLFWGGLWGIFEATVGFALHLFEINIGWLVWYSVAAFFMTNVYRTTRRTEAVVFTGLLSASIKLINLFSEVRIDKVINPAVSIIFEALSFALMLFVYRRLIIKKSAPIKGLAVLSANTSWRVLYILYLIFIAPDWIREISVIRNTEEFLRFFAFHNLLSTLVLFAGVLAMKFILKPITFIERKLSVSLLALPHKISQSIKLAGAVLIFAFAAFLEYVL